MNLVFAFFFTHNPSSQKLIQIHLLFVVIQHVMADTMRSIAVLIAAGIAWRYKSIDPSTADASAAVVVSIIIALSLGPLLAALVRTFKEIVDIRREKAVARRDAQNSTDNQTIWLEEFQSLPHGIQY